MTLYLDNAATTFPKPDSVYQAVQHALVDIGANPGRASHRLAREASAIISSTRTKAARFFGISNPEDLLFTKNATESINLVLKGWLRAGDRVLMSSIEHNSIVRPLERLRNAGIETTVIPCSPRGQIDLQALKRHLSPPPRLVALTHACNVNGALQPMPEIAALCAEQGVPLLLDAAQTAGLQPIPVEEWGLGMLACSGHKALLGPPGVGLLYIQPGLDVLPLIEGGTGSRSEEPSQPDFCPDRYESGTPNLPGVAGLEAGIDFILEKGLDTLRRHELEQASRVEKELAAFPGVRVWSPETRGTGAVSFTVDGLNPTDISSLLDEGFDIAVRSGLHCAPMAHQTLGTFPEGTVRVSAGYSTTDEDLDYFLRSLHMLLSLRR